MSSSHSNIFDSGPPDCPCLKAEDVYPEGNSSIDERACDLLHDMFQFFEPKVDLKCPIPAGFGIGCKPHDLEVDRRCRDGQSVNIKSFCYKPWCYVDKEKCLSSNYTIVEDPVTNGLYYSYTSCVGSDFQKNYKSEFAKKSRIDNLIFDAIIPGEYFPYHFTEDTVESAGTNSTVMEWKGAVYDYLQLLPLKSPIKGFNFIDRVSGGSLNKAHNSSFTAALTDVTLGFGHIAAGAYWITAERLKIIDYTIPIHSSPLYFFELKRQDNDIGFAIKKTLRPFEMNLWGWVILCVISFAIANVMSTNARGDGSSWYQTFRNQRWRSASRAKRIQIGSQVYLEATLHAFAEYFSTATEMSQESTLDHKVLAFGFGFFILILTSSYTANLASFLTVPKVGDYVSDFEEVIENNLKVCAQDTLQETIHGRWPKVDEKNLMVWMDGSIPGYVVRAAKNLVDKKCDVFLADIVEIDFLQKKFHDEFCDHGIVSTKQELISLEWAIPIQKEFVADFSQSILLAQQNGIIFEDSLSVYSESLDCKVFIEPKGVDTAQLTILELILPFILVVVSITVGAIFKFLIQSGKWHSYSKALDEESNCNESNSPTVEGDGRFLDHPTEPKFSDDIEVDILEYKYRVDLLSYNIERLQKKLADSINTEDLELKNL